MQVALLVLASLGFQLPVDIHLPLQLLSVLLLGCSEQRNCMAVLASPETKAAYQAAATHISSLVGDTVGTVRGAASAMALPTPIRVSAPACMCVWLPTYPPLAGTAP